MTNQTIEKYTIEKVHEAIRQEIDTYNQYLKGDVYGFEIYRTCECCGSEVSTKEENCYGFYDMDFALKEAKGIVDQMNPNKVISIIKK